MERRLAAILAADLVGYGRLMDADEAGTLARLEKLTDEILVPLIKEHNGRLIKQMGDGFLMEFASIIDAVACALAWQDAVEIRASEATEDLALRFRIGVNLGDVIVKGDDVYGEGVNLAARLEGFAQPGSIVASQTVVDHTKGKLSAFFEDLGEQKLKNLPEPVRLYRVLKSNSETATSSAKRTVSVSRRPLAVITFFALLMATTGVVYLLWSREKIGSFREVDFCGQQTELKVPDTPSIAVLPFDNIGRDDGTQQVGGILSAAITTNLSKVPDLFVIAQKSSTMSRLEMQTKQGVAADLGVRFLIDGSVQQLGDRIRINTQLIDTHSDRQIWAESFDRTAANSLDVIDEISFEVVNSLEVTLTQGEQARIRGQGAKNIEAYQLFVRAMEEQLRFTPEGNAKAAELAKRATELEPEFWGGWTALGYATSSQYWYGSADKAESLNLGMQYANRALEVGGHANADAYVLMSFIENWAGHHYKSIELARKAIELSPNMADAWGQLGITLNSAGRPDDAIPVIENAMRLSPYYPTYLLLQLAKAYRHTGLHERAIVANRKLICRSPDSTFAHRDLALSYGALGDNDEAVMAIRELLKIQPDYSVKDYIEKGDSGIPPEIRKANVAILKNAGLPE